MGEVAKMNPGNVSSRRSTLAIAPEQDRFSKEQIAALKKMNGWRDVPDAELSVFFHQAQRTGLDPFAKQIYLIGRGSRSGNGMQYTIQTSIDGMRLVADRSGRYAGSDRPVFEADGKDEFAEVTVYKLVGNPASRVGFTGLAYRSEYAQERSPMWKKMPKTMLAKCAEANALRKAFPADLSGIYGSEEMDQAASPTIPGEAGLDPATEFPASEQPPRTSRPKGDVEEAEVVEQGQRKPKSENESSKLRKSEQDLLRTLIEETGHSVEGFEEKIGRIDEISTEVGEKWIERLREEHDRDDAADGDDFGNTLSEKERREIEDSVDEAEAQINKNDLPATRKQLNFLESLVGDEYNGDFGAFRDEVGKTLEQFTREEASEWIGRLSGKAAE